MFKIAILILFVFANILFVVAHLDNVYEGGGLGGGIGNSPYANIPFREFRSEYPYEGVRYSLENL